ncbi:hypothetical protein TWF730_004793 [Orbilia blumenaviensis]|uniref:Uncharacterized protein n=1 Tax=Orbilia blumenaviensis TaxID=1796055 RepID=A0AAV9TYZ6_9PEZI
MTSPTVNIFVSPGLYIKPGDIAAGDINFEPCGGTDRWCYLAPGNLTGTCGTWLGQSDYCCWAAVRENDVEGYKSCGNIAGIRDTPFNRFGSSNSFNATGNTCPSGSFEFFEYDTEGGDGIAACCPNGQTGQVLLIGANTDGTQYSLDSIRCGTFEVPGELQNPTTNPVPTATSEMDDSTTSAAVTSRGESTSRPPTSITQMDTNTASATGGQATSTTTSNSASNKPSKMAYLILGSVIFGLFFGGGL